MSRRNTTLTGRLGWMLDTAMTGLMIALLAPLFVLPVNTATGLLGRIGRFVVPNSPFARRIVDNVALVKPTMETEAVRALQRDVGAQFGRTVAEYVRLPTLAQMPERREVEGLEHLRAAMAAGRGVVIASAHFGNWEQIRMAAQDAGIEVGIIYRAFNNQTFDWISQTRIRCAGEPVLHKGREGMRAMLALLRRGGAILVLMDQHISGGAPLPFMGQPATTLTAIPALCRRSKAVLLPARALRAADGSRFHIRFEPPIPPTDPEDMARAINERIEAWVEEAPGQWFWLHQRWRERDAA